MAQPAGAGSSVNADLGGKIKAVTSILPVVATTTKTGVAVDLKGYESAVVLFHIGDSGDTLSGSVYITPSITECATVGGSYTAVPATGYREDVNDMSVIDAPAEDSKVIQVTLLAGLGRLEFIKPVLTLTGTHTNGTPVSACVIKGHSRVNPAING